MKDAEYGRWGRMVIQTNLVVLLRGRENGELIMPTLVDHKASSGRSRVLKSIDRQ